LEIPEFVFTLNFQRFRCSSSPPAWPTRRFAPAGRGRRDSGRSESRGQFEELFFTLSRCDTASMVEIWTIRQFSQANPQGDGQDNVPALLRRLADTIGDQGKIVVQDITYTNEIDEDGKWRPTMTVYFCPDERNIEGD
jgi:hypothetical protein